MALFNTNNPVPSTDGRDLSDNAQVLDSMLNSTGPVISRTGEVLAPVKALEAAYTFTAINSGVWAAGQSFTAVNQYMVFSGTAYKPRNSTTLPYVIGASPVSDPNVEVVGNLSSAQADLKSIARSVNVIEAQVIFSSDTSTSLDNVLYIYDATVQKTQGVPTLESAGKTIVSVVGDALTTTGGTGSNTYTLVAVATAITLENISELSFRAFDSRPVTVSRYVDNATVVKNIGGGNFTYDPARLKSTHDGGMFISDTVPFTGLISAIPDFLEGVGETDSGGSGCWVRELGDYETPEMFGAQGDGVTDDIFSISRCDAKSPSRHIKYTSGLYAIGAHPDHPEGFSPSRDRTTHEGVGFSWTSETGMTVFKYIGPENDVFAVLKLSRGDIGTNAASARNYIIKHIKLDANALAGFGLYENYANNDSAVENVVAVNARYRGVHVVKSWYNNMSNIVAYNNYGSGMSFGIPLDDLIPTTTEMLDINGFNILNPRAHSNGRQLPGETLVDWQARQFNEGAGRVANWGIGIGFVHGYKQDNPVSEKNYGPGIYRTNAGGSDTRGLVSYGGYVERNCDEAITDGTATDFWEVWHDGDDSSTRGEKFEGLWFNPSLDASSSKVKIIGTPKASNENELVRFEKCPNIKIPSPSHQQFGNDSDTGGSNMTDPYVKVFQAQGLASTCVTLRDPRDGTSIRFGTIRYDESPGSDNDKAIEFSPRFSTANISLRTARNATTGGIDAQSDLGKSGLRWDNGFFVNTPIGTSDRNEKDLFEDIDESWVDTLCAIASMVQKWKWKSAIADKGDNARWHIGPIAQEVYMAFEAVGVDAFEYGFIGKDLLTETVNVGTEKVEHDGEMVDKPIYEEQPILNEDGTQKERWSLRPTELQWAIMWAQQQKMNKLLELLG